MRLCSWRSIVACLLLFLLPLQGFAAATVFACHASSVPQDRLAQVQVQAPDHSHHHATNTANLAHADGKPAKCDNASPCCAGVLASMVRSPSFAPLLGGVLFPEPSAQVPSPTLAGLDRPPRHAFL
jgi:hypothetical protein